MTEELILTNMKKIVVSSIIIATIFSSNILQVKASDTALRFSGLLSLETRYKKDYEDINFSEFAVDELDFIIETQVNKSITGLISFIYEQNIRPLEVDEAMITIGKAPTYLSIGQMYVPFANLESNMISDPLTFALGEIREPALLLSAKTGVFYSHVYAFNGAEDTISHYGVNLGFTKTTENYNFDIGMSYINDIAHSYKLGFIKGDYVDGLAAYLILDVDDVNIIAEYVTALNQFNEAYLPFNGVGAEPKAWNVELSYTLPIAGKEATFAVGYQSLAEAGLVIDLPERRYLATASVGIFDKTTLSLEYAFDKDYDITDGGTGKNGHSAILQLAMEF